MNFTLKKAPQAITPEAVLHVHRDTNTRELHPRAGLERCARA